MHIVFANNLCCLFRRRLDFQPFEGVQFSDPRPNNVVVCAKERGRTKRLFQALQTFFSIFVIPPLPPPEK